MSANIQPVVTDAGDTNETLAALDAPTVAEQDMGAPAVAPATDAAPAASPAPVKRKRGRPQGSRTRKRFTRDVARSNSAPSVTASAPADGVPLTGTVHDGPAPLAGTAGPRAMPTPEDVKYTAAFTGLAVLGVTAALARALKNPSYAPTPEEFQSMAEAGARYYLHKYPNGIDDAPGLALLAAVGLYAARATGVLDKLMASMTGGVPAAPGAPEAATA